MPITVSVVIPCLNEESHIGQCLDSVLSTDFPKEQLEVIVVDGLSADKTREIVKKYEKKHAFIRLMDNPEKIQQIALNRGIKASHGSYVIRLDARATLAPNYISTCLHYIEKTGADCVGGRLETQPQKNTAIGHAITFVMGHPFGVGSGFRTVSSDDFEPFETNTVPFGCYRKSVFDKIGYYHEKLAYSEDADFHTRMAAANCKVMMIPGTRSYYFARATLSSFLKHAYRNGIWAILPTLYTNTIVVKLKHFVPFIFVSTLLILLLGGLFTPYSLMALLAVLVLYFGLGVSIAAGFAVKRKNPAYVLLIPLSLTILHVFYGLGTLAGLSKMAKAYAS